MSSFTVVAASVKKEFPATAEKPNAKKVLALTLKDHMDQTKDGEWFTNASTLLPDAGSTLEGDLSWDEKFRRWSFKKAGGFTGGGGGGGWRPRDPKETAAIQRQHSQSVAVEYIKAKANAGAIGPASNFPDTEQLRALIDWFQRDIEHGVALAQQQASYGTPQRKDIEQTGLSDVPSDGAPQHPLVTDDASIPY